MTLLLDIFGKLVPGAPLMGPAPTRGGVVFLEKLKCVNLTGWAAFGGDTDHDEVYICPEIDGINALAAIDGLDDEIPEANLTLFRKLKELLIGMTFTKDGDEHIFNPPVPLPFTDRCSVVVWESDAANVSPFSFSSGDDKIGGWPVSSVRDKSRTIRLGDTGDYDLTFSTYGVDEVLPPQLRDLVSVLLGIVPATATPGTPADAALSVLSAVGILAGATPAALHVADVVTWDPWVSLGGQATSGPAVTTWSPDRSDVFVRGTDNALWHAWGDSGRWSEWESLGGVLESAPAAVSWQSGRIDLVARGTDQALWHKWFDGGAWSDWESLGGELFGSPAVATRGPGRLDVAVRGTDRALWTRSYDGAWGDWVSRGGKLTNSPTACAGQVAGDIQIVAPGTGGELYQLTCSGMTWSSWSALMPSETGVPAIAGSKGDLRVFQRTLTGEPCYRDARGNRFVLDGKTLDTPASCADSAGNLHVAVRGTDNAVYVRVGRRA